MTTADRERRPATLAGIGWRGWRGAARRTVAAVRDDNLADWAAALTYYGVLSLFPGLLVLISSLRLIGPANGQRVVDAITELAPGQARDLLQAAVTDLQRGQQSTAGVLALLGVAGALWSASGYVGAFMRAANAIYDVPEGRPIWKLLPLRILVTVLAGTVLAASATAVVLTGGIARWLGELLHLGSGVVTAWDIAKWPVLVVLISLLIGLLYWASPNAMVGGFRWITPGGVLAVLVWLAASAGFALYVANFGNYNKVYGSLAAVIVFLVWLWISNLAILLGAEFDAELQRSRAIEAGRSATDEPYLELRDTRTLDAEPSP